MHRIFCLTLDIFGLIFPVPLTLNDKRTLQQNNIFHKTRVLKDVEKRNRRGQVESHHCDDRIRFYIVWSENPMPNRMHPKMHGTNERAVFVHFQTLHVWVYLPI